MNIWNNRTWKPMLLKEIDKPFNSDDYIYEIKYDGIRAICYVNNKSIAFISRNGHDLTNNFPELKSIKNNIKKNVIFDGEIVLLNDEGKPTFADLLKRNRLKTKSKIELLSKTNPVIFIAFDILYENKDLTNLPLMKRKDILDKYSDTDEFIKTKYIDTEGIKLFKEIKKRDLEGIVAKHKESTYHINKRTNDFIKIKNIKRDEYYIGGYEIKKENLTIYLGELKNNKLVYRGRCSLSLNNKDTKTILASKKSNNNFLDLQEDIVYLKPTLQCYVDYTEKTKNNHLRHSVFKGLV